MSPKDVESSIASPKPFVALYEFHQGSEPLTVWTQGQLLGNESGFRWEVASLPAVPDGAGLCPPISRVLSDRGDLSYIAFYTTIPDVEARGFSRSISFVISHQSKALIHAIQCSSVLDDVESALRKLQANAMDRFRCEFGRVFWEISKIVGDHPKLEAKHNEMKRIAEEWKINAEEPDNSDGVEIDPAKFSEIDNNLRDINQLMGMDQGILDSVIADLVRDERAAWIRERANRVTCKLSMDFGGVESHYPETVSQLFEQAGGFDSDMFKVMTFVNDGILAHMLFSILGGATLVIQSCKFFDEAVKFARKMCLFVPLFSPERLFVCDEIDVDDCYEYSVVATKKIENLTFEHDLISFLDLDGSFYRGPICPESSYVRKMIANMNGEVGEFSFLMTAIKRMEITDNKMARLMASWIDNVPTKYHGETGACAALTQNFFQERDICLLRYLIYAQINTNCARVLPAVGNETCIGFVVHIA